jgi:MoaA/NifB/PqqE/SkfB family radical SAM enzyme
MGILHHQIVQDLQGPPKVNVVELFVSDRCPLKCRHCFHADVHSIEPSLSVEEWKFVIDQFLDLGVRHFHVAGREPFTEVATMSILTYLAEKKNIHDLKFGVISNGLNCRKYLRELRDLNLDYLEISLDGLEDTHNYLRGNRIHHHVIETLKEALLLLGNHRVSTATVLHRSNVSEIPEFICSLGELGIRRFFFQPIEPVGYALGLTKLLLDPVEYRRSIIQIRDLLASPSYQKRPASIVFYVPSEMVRVLCMGESWLEDELYRCLMGTLAITAQGPTRLLLDFEAVRAPYWNHVVITEDGYLIERCSSRSTQQYREQSIGNAVRTPIADLMKTARSMSADYLVKHLINLLPL